MKTLIAALALSTLALPAYAAESYTLDPAHTAVTWEISHFDFSHPSGKFMGIDGKLMLDEAKPENSKVTATIPIPGVQTGVPKLDEHLKSPDFFNVQAFSTATFTSEKVTLLGKDHAQVQGNLRMLGVTKPITLDVKLNKIGENMMKKKTAGFSATAMLKRSDFGMTKYLPGLGDEVKLTIETEANLDAPATAAPAPTKP